MRKELLNTQTSDTLVLNTTLALPPANYYVQAYRKNLIALHHTVGGTAKSTYEWWKTRKGGTGTVGAAFMIDRDGSVYEVFEPQYWAYHLGTGYSPDEKRSIGIELCSEGGLTYSNGYLYSFDRITERTKHSHVAEAGKHFDNKAVWRGYRYWDRYDPAQMRSLFHLVDWLCQEFRIPRMTPADHQATNLKLRGTFAGVIAHHQVRADKSDLHPGFDWAGLMEHCGLKAV